MNPQPRTIVIWVAIGASFVGTILMIVPSMLSAATWLPGFFATDIGILLFFFTLWVARLVILQGWLPDVISAWERVATTKVEIARKSWIEVESGVHGPDHRTTTFNVFAPQQAIDSAQNWEPPALQPHTYSPKITYMGRPESPGGMLAEAQPQITAELPDSVDLLSRLRMLDRDLRSPDDDPLLYLGESLSGPLILRLSELYHLGWQGPTQSGKTAAQRAIVYQLRRRWPTTLIVLIDPLNKAAKHYAGIPGVAVGNNPASAVDMMNKVHTTIINRTRKSDAEIAALPYMLVIIDELYFCVNMFNKELIQKLNESYSIAASSKVFFLAGTQKMKVENFDMGKVNTRSRFAFGGSDHKTVTAWDMNIRLLPVERKQGRAYYYFSDVSTVEEQEGQMQFAYISPEDMRKELAASSVTQVVPVTKKQPVRLTQNQQTVFDLWEKCGRKVSQSLIDESGIARSTVYKTVQELRDLGLIS